MLLLTKQTRVVFVKNGTKHEYFVAKSLICILNPTTSRLKSNLSLKLLRELGKKTKIPIFFFLYRQLYTISRLCATYSFPIYKYGCFRIQNCSKLNFQASKASSFLCCHEHSHAISIDNHVYCVSFNLRECNFFDRMI